MTLINLHYKYNFNLPTYLTSKEYPTTNMYKPYSVCHIYKTDYSKSLFKGLFSSFGLVWTFNYGEKIYNYM